MNWWRWWSWRWSHHKHCDSLLKTTLFIACMAGLYISLKIFHMIVWKQSVTHIPPVCVSESVNDSYHWSVNEQKGNEVENAYSSQPHTMIHSAWPYKLQPQTPIFCLLSIVCSLNLLLMNGQITQYKNNSSSTTVYTAAFNYLYFHPTWVVYQIILATNTLMQWSYNFLGSSIIELIISFLMHTHMVLNWTFSWCLILLLYVLYACSEKKRQNWKERFITGSLFPVNQSCWYVTDWISPSPLTDLSANSTTTHLSHHVPLCAQRVASPLICLCSKHVSWQ